MCDGPDTQEPRLAVDAPLCKQGTAPIVPGIYICRARRPGPLRVPEITAGRRPLNTGLSDDFPNASIRSPSTAWARAGHTTTSASVIPGLRDESEPSVSAWALFPARQIGKLPRPTVRERCARIGRLAKIGSQGQVSELRWVCSLRDMSEKPTLCYARHRKCGRRSASGLVRRVAPTVRAAGEVRSRGCGGSCKRLLKRGCAHGLRLAVRAHHRRRVALTGPGPSSFSGHKGRLELMMLPEASPPLRTKHVFPEEHALHNPDQLGDTRLKRRVFITDAVHTLQCHTGNTARERRIRSGNRGTHLRVVDLAVLHRGSL